MPGNNFRKCIIFFFYFLLLARGCKSASQPVEHKYLNPRWRGKTGKTILSMCVRTSISARRAVSQFWSFKIRRTTFLNYIKFVDPRILRLQNCERARRVSSTEFLARGSNDDIRAERKNTDYKSNQSLKLSGGGFFSLLDLISAWRILMPAWPRIWQI